MRMRRVVWSSVAWPVLSHFSTLFQKRYDFLKTLFNIKCVFWFSLQLLSETFFIVRRIQRDIVRNVQTSSRKVPVILANCNKLEFSRQIFEKYSNIKSHENQSSFCRVVPCGRPAGQRVGKTDGQTCRRQYMLFSILQTRLTRCNSWENKTVYWIRIIGYWELGCIMSTVYNKTEL
jgi:hypothetical protein